MHTLLVQMSTDPSRADEVQAHLREDVVSWARRQPGFVTDQWLLTADGRNAVGVVVFAAEEAAKAAASGPQKYRRDEARAWNINSVVVLKPVTSAGADARDCCARRT